jgi:hypothetical protein
VDASAYRALVHVDLFVGKVRHVLEGVDGDQHGACEAERWREALLVRGDDDETE